MLPSTSPNTFYHIGIMPSWILVQSYVQKHSFLGEIFSPGSWWFVTIHFYAPLDHLLGDPTPLGHPFVALGPLLCTRSPFSFF